MIHFDQLFKLSQTRKTLENVYNISSQAFTLSIAATLNGLTTRWLFLLPYGSYLKNKKPSAKSAEGFLFFDFLLQKMRKEIKISISLRMLLFRAFFLGLKSEVAGELPFNFHTFNF